MEKIDDIVAKLTPEERELHRELIEECREREISVIQIGQVLRENVLKLTLISLKILSDLDKFYKLSVELKETCQNVKDNILKDSIALIPDDKFYRA